MNRPLDYTTHPRTHSSSVQVHSVLRATQYHSLLDNAPNYLVGWCIIQKRSLSVNSDWPSIQLVDFQHRIVVPARILKCVWHARSIRFYAHFFFFFLLTSRPLVLLIFSLFCGPHAYNCRASGRGYLLRYVFTWGSAKFPMHAPAPFA